MEESLEECFQDSNEYPDSLDGLPPPEEQEVYDSEEAIVKRKKRVCAFWKKPITKVYADNFGFSVNGYQPMIDYIDDKDSGGSANKSDVHLPFLEERCMNKYSSQKPIKHYDNKDIDKYIAKGEKIRTQIRQNDAAGASNVHRRTHTNWSMTQKSVQLVKKSFVVDYRKIHSNKEEEDDELGPLPNYTSKPYTRKAPSYTLASFIPKLLISDMATAGILSSYVRDKLDHDHEMAARRERLKALDDQYEQNLEKLSYVVNRIGDRAESMPRIISPHGRVYSNQDMLDVTDDLIYNNRMKRQQDLYRMACDVNSITSGNLSRYRPSSINPRYDNNDMYSVDPTIIAIAKRNANAALAMRNRPDYHSSEYDDSDIDGLRSRYLNTPSVPEVEVLPPRKPKVVHEDIISDVQTRILNRAREMGGVSTESRRINNRARFVNTVSPRPDTGAVDLRVPPSRTERNIVNMAKSLAYTGKAARRYDVDDEVDAPVSNLNTHINKTYCSRELQKPPPEVPSDSNRVRNATIRARTRNTILGN
ncbi:UNVERIFIED_CONTAM: hypothetical protein GTU68_006511 [Idotea baltica]|nr:hypothetical protein [Idotea baltica]